MLNKQILSSLRKWIENQLPSSCPADESIPYDWPINSRMVEMAADASNLETRESVLNLLASQGIFSEKERRDLAAFVSRLLAINRFDDLESLIHQSTSNVTLSDLQSTVLDYCAQHVRPALLYDIISGVDVNLEERPVWMKLIHTFQQWRRNQGDADAFLNVCLVNNTFLKEKSHSLEDEELWKAHPFVALFLHRLDASRLANGTLEKVLQSIPMLANACSKVHAGPSIHQLLVGEIPVNVEQFFKWRQPGQKMDVLFPHFAHPELSSKHGLTAFIDWTFYLRQGRPFQAFAFASSKETRENISVYPFAVQAIAQEDPFNLAVAQSCVLFIEMLGYDSHPLRLTLAALDRIARESVLDRTKLCALSRNLMTDSGAARTLADQMEEILLKSADASSSMESIESWHLAVDFSSTYGLDLPVKFLHQCAARNNWLAFLVFIQRYGYSSKHFRAALQEFSPPSKQHLELALAPLLDHKELVPPDETFYRLLLQDSSNPSEIPFSVLSSRTDLAVLTADLHGHQIFPCLCIYLRLQLPAEAPPMELDVEQLNGDALGKLISTLMSLDRFGAVLEAFRIFHPDHLLTQTLDWLDNFSRGAADKAAVERLRDSLATACDDADSFFINSIDVQGLAFQICTWALSNVIRDPDQQLDFVILLAEVQPFETLATSDAPIPDFNLMAEIMALCLASGTQLDVANLMEGNLQEECQKAVEPLLQKHQFEVALKLAKLSDLPADFIFVTQVLIKSKTFF